VAYITIADAAWTTTDDGPLASCHSVTVRNNAAQCSEQRVPTTAIVFPAAEPLRLCSYFDTCTGPYFIWLPPSEDFDSLTVYVQVEDVELEGESAGYTAAYLYATIGTVGDGWIDKPPQPPTLSGVTNWTLLVKGDSGSYQVPGDDPDDPQPIPVSNANKVNGWVPVFLWVRSLPASSAEDSGDIDEEQGRSNSVSLSAEPDPVPTTPPERVIQINASYITQGDPYSSDVYQWCHYRDEGSSYWAELAPLLPTGGPSPSTWSSYCLGVVVISSITIIATPAPFEPAAAAYYSAVPAAEQWLNLAYRVNRLINHRTAQWSCNPGPDSYVDGEYSRQWPIRSRAVFGFNGADPLDADYQTLLGALIVDEPPDDNGYDAIVSFLIVRRYAVASDEPPSMPVDMTLRLSAYDAGSSLPPRQASGEPLQVSASDLQAISTTTANAFREAKYSPAKQALARASVVVDWQLRGHLGSHNLRLGTGTHDWTTVLSALLPPLPADSLSYPIRVVVEAKLSGTYEPLIVAIVGGAIRSRNVEAE